MVSTPGAPDPETLIAVGIVRKAHGVRGEASVESLTASLDRFSALDHVWLVSPDRDQVIGTRVVSARPHGERALVRLEEITSPERVREFHNWTIEVPESDARELEENEYFLHDLEGLAAVDPQGQVIGTVSEVQETAAGILLVISQGKRTFDVPFVEALCTEVDLDSRTITMDLPEGLIDLGSVVAVEEDPSIAEALASEEADSTAEASDRAEEEPRLRVDVVTIFPGMIESLMAQGIVARAIQRNVIQVKPRDLREYATDRHRSTDDEAYGGGAGMVMLAEPLGRCIDALAEERGQRPWVVLMSPQGRRFDQELAREMAGRGSIAIICGRYEGVDERLREELVDQEVSVGDFVVSGGELPAMLVIDAVSRMVEGVVGDRNSVEADSFYNGLLDYPHYTRPAEWRGRRVPDVLLSGHAENIRRWRKEQSLRATLRKRPDLIERASLDDEAREMLRRIRSEQAGD